MTTKKTEIQDADRGLYPIRTVSDLTGVNAITLRAWESRHGLVVPVRKESGHRLYTQEHIDLINRVVGLLDRGMRIGEVKAFLDANDQQDELAESDTSGKRWRRYIDGMLAGVIRFDEEALEAVYNDALSLHSINEVTEKLVTPLLVELGRRWVSDEGSVAEEHFFGFYLRNKLGARFHHRVRNRTGPVLLMACLPGERHVVGLLLFALAANNAGYRPIILGSDMPLEEMAAAASKTDPAAIVLSGLLVPGSTVLNQKLPDMVAAVDIPVVIGGRVSVEVYDSLKKIGVEPLGSDPSAGLRQLQTIVPTEVD